MGEDLDISAQLVPVRREIGSNTVGLLAWRCHLVTREYPEGRDMMLLANDITHQAGSFGLMEGKVFAKASEMARNEGIPLIYIASNSGARVGFFDELAARIRPAWEGEGRLAAPGQGEEGASNGVKGAGQV